MPDQTTRVAAYVVLVQGEKVLLCRLGPLSNNPGLWTVPGGGLDFGEHPEAGAIREVFEETGYMVTLNELLAVDSVVEGPVHGILFVYAGEITGGELRPEVGGSTDLPAWLTKEEALQLPMGDLARMAVRLAFG